MDTNFFIKKMKNSDIQRKLLTEILPTLEALEVALIDERKNQEPHEKGE